MMVGAIVTDLGERDMKFRYSLGFLYVIFVLLVTSSLSLFSFF